MRVIEAVPGDLLLGVVRRHPTLKLVVASEGAAAFVYAQSDDLASRFKQLDAGRSRWRAVCAGAQSIE